MTLRKNLFFYLFVGATMFAWMVANPRASVAQEIMLGGFMPAGKNVTRKPNPRIQSKWSEERNGLSMRVNDDAKSRWGIAEPPTFLLQLKNLTENAKEISISPDELTLSINDKSYVWNSPGTKIITTLKPKETKPSFFILRLDPNQWKPVNDKGSDEKTGDPQKLASLDVGKKEFEIKLNVGQENNEDQLLSTGKIKFEITPAVFELPTVGGVVLGADGKPLKDAEIYLCKDAQFSIYYSGYDGKWFKSKSVSHYDPFGGGFANQIKPVKTNDKGEFAFSPGFRDKRIVVLPPMGSAQIFDLPTNYSTWKVQLRETGSMLIEHDIEGETATANASVTSSRILAVNEKKQTFMFTESFNIPLANGKKYEFNNIWPTRFNLNRYKYVRVGNRSYSIGRMNRTLDIEAGKQTEFRMVRKTGQKVKLTATKVPTKMQYVVASIFDLNEPINTSSIYSNQTLWSDASAEGEKKIDFQSCLISPGKYRLVVMSVPPGKKPNQYTYKPDHIGSKIIEIKKDGTLDAGDIRLFPVETWVRNSGMSLDLKLINKEGTSPGARSVWPINRGYKAGFNGTEFKTNGLGLANVLRPSGKYQFATGLDHYQPTFFEVSVPRMTPQTVILEEKAIWATEDSEKLNLEVQAKFDQENGTVLVTVENNGEKPFKPRLGDVQILMQTQLTNKSVGVRFMPHEESKIYATMIQPKSKVSFELKRAELLDKAICVSSRLNILKIQESKDVPPENLVFAGVRVATKVSKVFFVPQLPALPPKPFR